MNTRSHLKVAKGHGSAHDGTKHFIAQRLTAVALIPLLLWFVYNIAKLAKSGSYTDAINFFASPLNSILVASIVIASFWHAALGLQVIIEDYLHGKAKKFIALTIVKLGSFVLAMASLIAIAHIQTLN